MGVYNIWYQSHNARPNCEKKKLKSFFLKSELKEIQNMAAETNFVQPAIPKLDGHYDHRSMLMETFFVERNIGPRYINKLRKFFKK